jgi:hypothetical protein
MAVARKTCVVLCQLIIKTDPKTYWYLIIPKLVIFALKLHTSAHYPGVITTIGTTATLT